VATAIIPRHLLPERIEYVNQWKRRAWRDRREEYLADKCCAHCGAASFLELHHRDPNTKVSHRDIWRWCRERREVELAKCVVLCDACHNRLSEFTKMLKRGWIGWRAQGVA